ncbi:MAG: DUF4968 domain-containing protein [Clostridiales bacterium]|nr:DUF4968 domain-containing protein [Clostridiales bacterium]
MERFFTTSAPGFEKAIFENNSIRLTMITPRILRVEYSPEGKFSDKKTQMVVCRDFCPVNIQVEIKNNFIVIKAQNGAFRVNTDNLRVEAAINGKWVYPSNESNLGGTARTLDGTFGVVGTWKGKKERRDHFGLCHIRKGIFSENGVAEIDDSDSFLYCEDGGVALPDKNHKDKYVFAFGDDYFGGLREFYSLCGKIPVLPKYALGNWWSRYHAYTQKEYTDLMTKFHDLHIPFTVATIDMDWHIVKNVPKDVKATVIQGAGWTGYTFEKALFPDYKQFFSDLKKLGLAITMNLHPHDGVRYFESQYDEMCKAVGKSPKDKKPVKFNLTDKKFIPAYFDILHHPYEESGVDFWWIDWQQGTKSKDMMGLDPLPLLNHYHYIDSCRNNKAGLILSRYASLGSHRYPVGFSGDTYVLWASLKLQPWFTSMAANAGYTWWSHDIGGHVMNSGNNELYLRWVQYGVFSPINRLHSNNTSISKEPWNFPKTAKIAVEYLRFRHRLIPYLYTANVENSENGTPLICPMYYRDKSPMAYSEKYKNQYWFGENIIVAPVVSPIKGSKPNVSFYLPDGEWYNIFTGKKYESGEYSIQCPLDEYPVFAKKGAIIPLLADRFGNSMEYTELEVLAVSGDGEYTLRDEGNGDIHFTLTDDVLSADRINNNSVNKISVRFIDLNKEETIFIK